MYTYSACSCVVASGAPGSVLVVTTTAEGGLVPITFVCARRRGSSHWACLAGLLVNCCWFLALWPWPRLSTPLCCFFLTAGVIGNPPVLLSLHVTLETPFFHLSTHPFCSHANGLRTVAIGVLATRTSVHVFSAAATDLAERHLNVCWRAVSLTSNTTYPRCCWAIMLKPVP